MESELNNPTVFGVSITYDRSSNGKQTSMNTQENGLVFKIHTIPHEHLSTSPQPLIPDVLREIGACRA
ncbi:hypothetical protein GJ744_004805 [Endocarpon pusillum]|uniref:Uncharacterized protein n=1 Tax=Endocarpon pusillum TaxID=364733 RepID=A0A8H7DXF8_9EURO|nr:hypothetical protein GJ744_004805 [Endocarpon pusillum]